MSYARIMQVVLGAFARMPPTEDSPGVGRRVVVNVRDHGATGNGASDDTVAINHAISALTSANGGDLVFPPASNYYRISATLAALPSHTVVRGRGQIRQVTAGQGVFSVTDQSSIHFTGLRLYGPSAASNQAAVSGEHAVLATGCSDVRVDDVRFERFGNAAIELDGCSDLLVSRNKIYQCFAGPRLRGASRFSVSSNLLHQTNAPNSSVALGIVLDSVNGHNYGVCTDGVVAGNQISAFVCGQAILLHAGERITISGNTMNDVLHGVSLNPYSGEAGDVIRDISIVGNTYVGTTVAGALDSYGNYGVSVQGGSGGEPSPTSISIIGNSIRGANAIATSATQGGIVVSRCYAVTISGNIIQSCYGSGVVANINAIDVVVANNIIRNTIASTGGSRYGVYSISTGNILRVVENFMDDALVGVRFDAASASSVVADNQMVSVTTRHAGAGAATDPTFDGVATYVAGATTIDGRNGSTQFVYIANAGAVTITNITNGVNGQEVVLLFGDTNTTFNRDNALLAGGTNFTSSAGATLRLRKYGSYWYEQGRTTNAA